MALKTRTSPRPSSPKPDFSRGWKEVVVNTPDGRREVVQIPLTSEEALHPEEGFIMPESTEHARLIKRINDMLETHYASQADMAVFSDLIIQWDKPELKHHCPDISVIPNVKNPKKKRSRFVVPKEGTRPVLLIEIVSPGSKEADRVKKVDQYARAGVQEYVYIDSWDRENRVVWELAGFRLAEDRYLPILPDEEGSLYCESVGLRIGLKEGNVWMQDYESGVYLMTNLEAQSARQVAEGRADDAEAKLAEEKAAREALEARVRELESSQLNS